jgi:hypothetical protein
VKIKYGVYLFIFTIILYKYFSVGYISEGIAAVCSEGQYIFDERACESLGLILHREIDMKSGRVSIVLPIKFLTSLGDVMPGVSSVYGYFLNISFMDENFDSSFWLNNSPGGYYDSTLKSRLQSGDYELVEIKGDLSKYKVLYGAPRYIYYYRGKSQITCEVNCIYQTALKNSASETVNLMYAFPAEWLELGYDPDVFVNFFSMIVFNEKDLL